MGARENNTYDTYKATQLNQIEITDHVCSYHSIYHHKISRCGNIFMRNRRTFLKTFLLCCFVALPSAVQARMIAFDRWVVPAELLHASFHTEDTLPGITVFHIGSNKQFRDSPPKAVYHCRIAWDWALVRKASLEWARLLNEANTVNALEFLSQQGFKNCQQITVHNFFMWR